MASPHGRQVDSLDPRVCSRSWFGSEIADNYAQLLGWTDCPSVNEVFPRAIALPIFDEITERQIERVARALNRSF